MSATLESFDFEVIDPFQSPELTPAEQALLDVLTPDPEEMAVWRELFDETSKTALEQQLFPEQKAIIQAGLDRYEWRLFARPGEPLPETTVLTSTDEGSTLSTLYHPALPLDHFGLHSKMCELFNPTSGSLAERHSNFLGRRATELRAATTDLLHERPVYKLLHSLVDQPPESPTPQPISPAWRRIRANQEEHDIRDGFGIGESEAIPAHEPAGLALRRALHHIDQETEVRPLQKPSTAKERVDKWLVAELNALNFETATVRAIKEYDEFSGLRVVIERGGKFSDCTVSHSVMDKLSTGVSLRLSPGSQNPTVPFDGGLVQNFVRDLYLYNKHGNDDVAEALRRAEANTVRQLTDVVGGGVHETSPLDLHRNLQYLIWLRKPQQPIYDRTSYDQVLDQTQQAGAVLLNKNSRRPVIVNRDMEQARENVNQYMVVVQDPHNHTRRLILGRAPLGTIPSYAETFDMVLQENDILDSSLKDAVPFIPGYSTVAHKDDLWFFAREEHDMYEGGENIQLCPPDARNLDRLASEYRYLFSYSEISNRLTDAIRQLPEEPIAVSDLIEMIRASSDYTYDQRHQLWIGAHSLNDFGPEAFKDGRLQMQCTGAALFLAEALKIVIPEATITTISGSVLPVGTEAVSGVTHAQVMIELDGRQYILDATPALPKGSTEQLRRNSGRRGLGEMVLRGLRQKATRSKIERDIKQTAIEAKDTVPAAEVRQLINSVTGQFNLSPLKEVVADPAQASAERRAEMLRENRERVESILTRELGATDREDLQKKVLHLSPNDPLRRTLEAAMRLESGKIEAKDMVTVQEYLGHYLKADDTILRSMQLPKYGKHLIELLSNVLTTQ